MEASFQAGHALGTGHYNMILTEYLLFSAISKQQPND